MNLKQIFVIAIIAMFLVTPFAGAKQEVADNVKQDKKIDEKITDKTKESAKEISNKDKDIKGKVTVTDSDSSKYTVEKKSKTEIRIAKDEVKGEHTKSKVAFAKEDLQKIDVDGDKLYGVLHIADDGSTVHDVYTESQLTSGTEMIFSENIVNGYSGYKEITYTGVTSGTILDTPDVSGSDYYVTMSVNGTIPTSSEIIESNPATYPVSPTFLLPMDNATDVAGGKTATAVNMSYSNSAGIFNRYAYISYPNFINSTTFTLFYDAMHIGAGLSTQAGIISQRTAGWGGIYFTTSNNNMQGTYVNATGATVTSAAYTTSSNRRYNVAVVVNGSAHTITRYVNGVPSAPLSYVGDIRTSADPFFVGRYTPGKELYGSIHTVGAWNGVALTSSQVREIYSGHSGISAKPTPSYNFTGYNVASGVEKIIDTDATSTGLEYIDTTGGTHTVTVRIYFTEDITKTTETKGAVYQNVSIIHTKQNATASVGSIAWELDPLYSGDPVLTSNNTNATVSRNDTHVLISTGLVKQGQSFSYALSVPDNHDHIIFKNRLMQWMGSGWDYVGDAPANWSGAIYNIRVIVS